MIPALRGLGQAGDFSFLVLCAVEMVTDGGGAMPFYVPPPESFERAGCVVWPTLRQSRFATWSALTTVFHEAVPGHHTQLGGSRLLDLTRIQRVGAAAGHAEGWALYAEQLMDELGAFATLASRLGFLNMQAFRAVRVVVDMGLHTQRLIPEGFADAGELWTFDRAVAAIARASGFPPASARMEVERYLACPAQATAYKLGERVWLSARAEAMARQGIRFDRRAWHMQALALGPREHLSPLLDRSSDPKGAEKDARPIDSTSNFIRRRCIVSIQ
jgi:uncharacterized protein (DUF885 family)